MRINPVSLSRSGRIAVPQIRLKLPSLTQLTCVLVLQFCFFGLIATEPVRGQDSAPSTQNGGRNWNSDRFPFRVSSRRENGQMMDLIKPVCVQAGKGTVQIYCNNRPVALGLVVHPSGLAVTKHSELTGDSIRVRLPDDRMVSASIAAIRREDDLALLRLEANELEAIAFAEEEPSVGQFIVTVGRGGRPLHLGAISVGRRKIEATGRLGIQLENNSEGLATVNLVLPDSGASEAGIRLGDKIVAIEGTPSTGSAQVVSFLRNFFPGENIKLTIRRDKDTVEINAQIREFIVMLESENDSLLNGPRNSRLSGFTSVLQHDTVLEPDQCGGPLIDSHGRVIGLNIARAGRVVSYALPAAIVQPLVESMVEEVLAGRDLSPVAEATVSTLDPETQESADPVSSETP